MKDRHGFIDTHSRLPLLDTGLDHQAAIGNSIPTEPYQQRERATSASRRRKWQR
jgi:hypothetical protein